MLVVHWEAMEGSWGGGPKEDGPGEEIEGWWPWGGCPEQEVVWGRRGS